MATFKPASAFGTDNYQASQGRQQEGHAGDHACDFLCMGAPHPTPGLTCARTLVHDVSCTTDSSGYHTITESNLAAQKSGSWTWRDPDVAHLSKALSINLPLYARAARKQSSKAPLRELSNQSLHSNSSQGQGEQLDGLHVVL